MPGQLLIYLMLQQPLEGLLSFFLHRYENCSTERLRIHLHLGQDFPGKIVAVSG
jgi:hypothetical protein